MALLLMTTLFSCDRRGRSITARNAVILIKFYDQEERKMKTILSAVFIAIISTNPVLATAPANETTPPSVAMPREQLSQEAEEMKKTIRGMFGELAKNRDLLREITREMLNEASRNKELLKEIIRGLAQNRETIRAAIRDLMTDKDLQKALREDRELINELLEELSRNPPPDKTVPGKHD